MHYILKVGVDALHMQEIDGLQHILEEHVAFEFLMNEIPTFKGPTSDWLTTGHQWGQTANWQHMPIEPVNAKL